MNQLIKLSVVIIISLGSGLQAQNNLEKLKEYINGGQLVIYSKSSYLSDNTASSITYVDFCSDGRYRYYYDGSYTVKGAKNKSNRNNRSYGAGVAESEGQWTIIDYQDVFYLEITDYLNKKTYYPINIANLTQGSWKQGNISYAFAQNQARCQ
jgi:hypothetical protein